MNLCGRYQTFTDTNRQHITSKLPFSGHLSGQNGPHVEISGGASNHANSHCYRSNFGWPPRADLAVHVPKRRLQIIQSGNGRLRHIDQWL